jgi:hypothetical protein
MGTTKQVAPKKSGPVKKKPEPCPECGEPQEPTRVLSPFKDKPANMNEAVAALRMMADWCTTALPGVVELTQMREHGKACPQAQIEAVALAERVGKALGQFYAAFETWATVHHGNKGAFEKGPFVVGFEPGGRASTSWKAVATDEAKEIADLKKEPFDLPKFEAKIKADAKYTKGPSGEPKMSLMESA